MLQARQGDILFESAGRPTRPLRRVRPENGRLIIARGEQTGHHHWVDPSVATLELDEGGVAYLTIDQLTEVQHPEHGPTVLEPGTYEVIQQREHAATEVRPAGD
jgi:hypothetical protein